MDLKRLLFTLIKNHTLSCFLQEKHLQNLFSVVLNTEQESKMPFQIRYAFLLKFIFHMLSKTT